LKVQTNSKIKLFSFVPRKKMKRIFRIKAFLIAATVLMLILCIPLAISSITMGLMTLLSPPKHDVAMQGMEDTEWLITADGKKLIPAKYLPIYQAAGKKYGVPWNILAAIHKVETDFGRNLTISWAGAVGQMQTMPCAWVGWEYYRNYCNPLGNLMLGIDITNPKNIHGGQGLDADNDGKADPNDPVDAIYAAARRLASDKASTKRGWFDRGGPVWRYNPSQSYVDKVEMYANLFAQPVYQSINVVATGDVKKMLDAAVSYIGVIQYRFGGNSFPYLDCSSFTQYMYKKFLGINLPRTTEQQVLKGTPIPKEQLQPGDLVFFQGTYRPGVSHVGIYMGNGKFIHNQSTKKDMQISSLSDNYWIQHWYGARRVIKPVK
jgi:cell wall-associated NlpC family hydrolase